MLIDPVFAKIVFTQKLMVQGLRFGLAANFRAAGGQLIVNVTFRMIIQKNFRWKMEVVHEMLNVGYAGFLAFMFSAPVWLFLVRLGGFPADLMTLLTYSLIHGAVTLVISVIIIVFLKAQARRTV